jgi:hypothetical protein
MNNLDRLLNPKVALDSINFSINLMNPIAAFDRHHRLTPLEIFLVSP